MTTSDVKLLGTWASPFVNRAVMAFKIKCVEYEFVQMNPKEKTELLVKNNPVHKKVPVLIHADRPICESLVILQYIDDAWTNGPSILPSDPYDRAIARFWAAYIDDKLIPTFKQIRETEGDEAKKAVYEKIHEIFVLLEGAFVECSKGKAFFNGDNIGYLDIVLASFVGWIRVVEILNGTKILDETKTPHLVKWAERLYSDSCVKDVMLDPHSLLEFFNNMQASKAASD